MATIKVFGYTEKRYKFELDSHIVFWEPVGATMDLKGCELVIMPFAPLLAPTESAHQAAAEHLYRRARLCLESGASICLIYEDIDSIRGLGDNLSVRVVIGKMFLQSEGISHAILSRVRDLAGVNTLSPFLKEYASTNYYFSYREKGPQLRHTLCWPRDDEEDVCGFALEIEKGLLYVLPGAPIEGGETEFINSLIRCLLTDIRSRLYPETSPIIESFQFHAEKELRTSRHKLESQLQKIDHSIARYNQKKDILFLRDTPLENRLPEWLATYMGIRTRRHEEYNEDFWILDETGTTDVAICEAKGLSKNVKREHITALVQHREHHDLADDFPSVLFVNTFADAETVEEKARQRVTKIECQKACRDHVLIVRTLDLVRLLDLLEQNNMDSHKIRELLLTERGWLNVADDGYELITD